MVKLSLTSWLGSSSSSRNDVDRKKENRRTFSGFGAASPLSGGNRTNRTSVGNGLDGKAAAAATAATATAHANGAAGLNGKAGGASISTAASDTVVNPLGGQGGDTTTTATTMTTTTTTSSSGMTMTELADKISRETAKLEAYMRDNGLPMPGFEVDAADDFPKLPEDMQRSRLEVIHATKELRDLTVGPRESVRWGVWDFLDVLALQVINNYGIAKLVPLDHPIPLPDLARLTPLDPVNLARVLRTAMTNHIFHEPVPNVVAHTAASRLLAADPELAAWVGFNAEDIFPSAGHVLTALRRHPEATSLARAGFQFAFGTVDVEPMFATFGRDAARARRMGRAMASLTGGEGYEVAYLVGACDLSAVDARGGTFVDVGGSHGFVCVDLARRWRGVRFVVQDLQKTVESAPVPVDEDAQVAGRVRFETHDFFTSQELVADVYYFRWIMHNYSTPYAVSILRNLIPALRPGARIIINDHCLREPGQENPWDEKIMRRMDMVMLALLNAQERTEDEFRELFRSADEGFVFKGVTRPPGCRMSIIEAVWKPDEVVPIEAAPQSLGTQTDKTSA